MLQSRQQLTTWLAAIGLLCIGAVAGASVASRRDRRKNVEGSLEAQLDALQHALAALCGRPADNCRSDNANASSVLAGGDSVSMDHGPSRIAPSNGSSSSGGSREVLHWPCVVLAPAPSMQMEGVAVGQAASFTDARGSIYKFKLGEGVDVNMYYTSKGGRRSGDLHDCVQYDVVLRGAVRLRMLEPATGKEHVRLYRMHDIITIPPRTPHMFEMLEDNYLLEWWGGPFQAWYFQPYRDIITAGPSLECTAALDLSIDTAVLQEWFEHARQKMLCTAEAN